MPDALDGSGVGADQPVIEFIRGQRQFALLHGQVEIEQLLLDRAFLQYHYQQHFRAVDGDQRHVLENGTG